MQTSRWNATELISLRSRQWRSVTSLYFRNIMRCPMGQLLAILRGTVHHDATIPVSFIDRNVAEILCTKNRAPSFISFLGAMGAKVIPDFKPEAESSERGRNRNSTSSNRTAFLLRWHKELQNLSFPGLRAVYHSSRRDWFDVS
jgi:hypothetical protein